MKFEEKSLRDMLRSAYGRSIGQSLIDTIESGHAVLIAMESGATMVLDSKTRALEVMLELFGWAPD